MLNKIRKENTASVAKERLNVILATDRLHCSNEQMIELEKDIFHSINKYFVVSPSKIKTRVLCPDEKEDEILLIFEAIVKK